MVDSTISCQAENAGVNNKINSDLSNGARTDTAEILKENIGITFQGLKLVGDFLVSSEIARDWLNAPNPDGEINSDVLSPFISARDITQSSRDMWVIDFNQMQIKDAQRYPAPFKYVETHVKPERMKVNRVSTREKWWLHGESRPAMRRAISGLSRYLAIPAHAKYFNFVWLETKIMPDGGIFVIARDDDYTYGVLNSDLHDTWALKMGTSLEDRPRYTPTTCFETFPFPRPMPEQKLEIEKWAVYLEQCRAHLKGTGLTLTEMYNALEELRKQPKPDPTHRAFALLDAHERLDKSVHAAYGWDYPLTEDEILGKLLALNLERAAQESNVEPKIPVATDD
jgi:hypothetical protein